MRITKPRGPFKTSLVLTVSGDVVARIYNGGRNIVHVRALDGRTFLNESGITSPVRTFESRRLAQQFATKEWLQT